MKVFATHDYGQPPTATTVVIPQPNEGEVRVSVRAASVNGFDLAVANGYLRGAMEHDFPVVLGKDFAGEVDALGAGVDDFAVGDRVFGVVTKPRLGDGSMGEYVTVPTAIGIAKLPDSVGFIEGAALGLAGTAAVDAVDAAELKDGMTVLIAGATGGVGQQALQLAVEAGAQVIATASTPEENELVTRLGASHTVDYRSDVSAQVAMLHPEGVDVVLHFAGDPQALVAAVKPGGTLVSTMLQSPADLPAEGIQVRTIYANPSTSTLERIARAHADERTTLTVQQVYALEKATEAFSHFGSGTLGKLVISIK